MAGNREAYERAKRLALEHSQNHNWNEALEAYKQALVEFPQDEDATTGIGEVFLASGHLQAALKAFQQAAQIVPDNPRILSRLADVLERLEMPDAAAESCFQAGDLFAQQANLAGAAEMWQRAASLASDQEEGYRRLALSLEGEGLNSQSSAQYTILAGIFERHGDTDSAIDAYQHALQLDPDNEDAQSRLTTLESTDLSPSETLNLPDPEEPPDKQDNDLLSLEDLSVEEDILDYSPFEQARRHALQELAGLVFEIGEKDGLNTKNVRFLRQAIDQQTRGLLDEAIKNLRGALDNGFDRTALHFNLGTLYYERLYYDKAVEVFRYSMRDEDFKLGSHYALGLTYHADGKISRAAEHFIEVAKTVDIQTASPGQSNDLTTAYQKITDRYVAGGDTEKANIFNRTLIQFFSSGHWQQGVAAARRNMDTLTHDDGIMTLAEYLETPQTEVVVNTLALTADYVRRNILLTAAEECFHAIEKVPDHLALHTRLADILLKQERTEQASVTYRTIANTYQVRGETDQAMHMLQEVLQLTPLDIDARIMLVKMLVSRGIIDDALDHYVALADTYYQLAQLRKALETYGEALKLVSRSTDQQKWEVGILHLMADIFVQRFEWARATSAYESIVALVHDDEQALQALVNLYFKQDMDRKALQALDSLLDLYQQRGDKAKPLSILQEMRQAYPDEMGLRARLVAAYARQGLAKQALSEAAVLGEMQLKAGLRDEAAQTVQTIIKMGPDDVEKYRRLLTQIKNGNE